MKRKTRVHEAVSSRFSGGRITICGWVRTIRIGKEVAFMALNDGSALASIQVVATPVLTNYEDVCRIGTGAAIEVTGMLAESPAAGQKYELQAEEIIIIGPADESYPLQKKRHSFEYLRTIAHLRPRSNTFGAVFRVRSSLAQEVHRLD